MKLLVVASSYPHSGHPYSGTFNAKCVDALSKLCKTVEVLVPRPYVPPFVSSFMPRWRAYRCAKREESANGAVVFRPATPVIPLWRGAYWVDRAAFQFCRRVARQQHMRVTYDSILSFDLLGAGGIAWRIARDLGIPASGWATGSDVRVSRASSFGRSVIRALERLDLVFYQSHELREKAAVLLGVSTDKMPTHRHIVLPRGISEPPMLARDQIRNQIRSQLKIPSDAILVLNVGRVSRDKGIFELLEAVSLAGRRDPRIACVIVGSCPAFDESAAAQNQLSDTPGLQDRVKILPACPPAKVWEYLCAADIFVFTSHREGMPNSLLEAMAMGVPAVAFAIPPVQEIEAGRQTLVLVPSFDSVALAWEINQLASSLSKRAEIGTQGKREVLNRFLVRNSMSLALRKITAIVEQGGASRDNL
jgi:teichuronic acid biosynthesis glycosyltransferase TuaC